MFGESEEPHESLALALVALAVLASTGILVNDGLVHTFSAVAPPPSLSSLPSSSTRSTRTPSSSASTAAANRRVEVPRRLPHLPSLLSLRGRRQAALPGTSQPPAVTCTIAPDTDPAADTLLCNIFGIAEHNMVPAPALAIETHMSQQAPFSSNESAHPVSPGSQEDDNNDIKQESIDELYMENGDDDDDMDDCTEDFLADIVGRRDCNGDDVLSLVGLLMDANSDIENVQNVSAIQPLDEMDLDDDDLDLNDSHDTSVEEFSDEDDEENEDETGFYDMQFARRHPPSSSILSSHSRLDSVISATGTIVAAPAPLIEHGQAPSANLASGTTVISLPPILPAKLGPPSSTSEPNASLNASSSSSRAPSESAVGHTLRRRRLFPSLPRFSSASLIGTPSGIASVTPTTPSQPSSAFATHQGINTPVSPVVGTGHPQTWRSSTSRRLRQIPRRIRRNVGAVGRGSSLVAFGAILLLMMLWILRTRGWGLLPRFWQLMSRRNSANT